MQSRILKLQTTASQWKKRAEISAQKMTELDQKNKLILENMKKANASEQIRKELVLLSGVSIFV